MRRWAMMFIMGALLVFTGYAQAVGGGTLSTNSGWYPAGTTLNVTATPDGNSYFDTWLGDTNGATITGGTNIEFTVNSPMSLTGRFTHITYDIDASAGAGGSISPDGTVSVDQGSNQVFAITASNNYHIVDVVVDSSSKGPISSYTFSNVVASGHTIVASFDIDQYTIAFDSDGGTAITTQTNDYNSTVTAPTAPTKTGYTFAGWNPGLPGTMPASDVNVTAQWTVNQYTITFDSDGGTAVTTQTNDYNATVTAPTAPTKTGYDFVDWSPTLPAAMPASGLNVTATWTIKQYSVTYIAGANGSVTGSTSQTVDHGNDAAAVGAVASNGYHFVNWTGTYTSTDNSLTDTNLTNDITLTANFAINEYDLTISSAHAGGMGIPAVGSTTTTNEHGTLITASITNAPIVIPSNTMYLCTGWAATGTTPSTGTATNMSFTITNDVVITWQWQTNYWVEFAVDGN